MNILPIPALDGGHALFVIIEMLTGKKPSEKVLEYSTMVGLGLAPCVAALRQTGK